MSEYSGSFPPPPEDPPAPAAAPAPPSYSGSFPPPPDDHPPQPPPAPAEEYGGAFPPPPADPPAAYGGAFPPPPDGPAGTTTAPEPQAPAVHGRLGTFDLGLAVEPRRADDPDAGNDGTDVGTEGTEGGAADDAGEHAGTRVADAVIFTWTGMVATSPIPALQLLAATQNLPSGVLVDLTLGPRGVDDGSHPAHRLERGELSATTYSEKIEAVLSEEHGVTLDYESQIRPLLIDLDVNEIVLEYIAELRQEGYRTALVMNASRDVALGRRQMVPVHALFDVVVESWNQGVRKPNRVMYAAALRDLGLHDPTRAVVLDPSLPSVESARALGMVGIQVVRDPVQALRQLNVHLGRSGARTLGIDVDPHH